MSPDPEALKSKVPWYHAKLESINPETRKLLEERGVPSEDVLSHVQAIRDRAWSVYPYPCIGMFSFTRLQLVNHPLFTSTILPAMLKAGTTMLDLGCGFSSDLRYLVSSGVPSSNLAAIDNHDGFWNLGKELYRDHETMKATFVIADMTDLSSIPDNMLGRYDIVWAGASFHLFDWDQQVKAGIVAAKLLRDGKGSAIYGYQVGRTKGKAVRASNVVEGLMFNHDPESLKRIWEEVGQKVGQSFAVQSWMSDKGIDDLRKRDPELRLQRFAVVRVEGPDVDGQKSAL